MTTILQRYRQRDGRTDRQTTCHGNTALCSVASFGKTVDSESILWMLGVVSQCDISQPTNPAWNILPSVQRRWYMYDVLFSVESVCVFVCRHDKSWTARDIVRKFSWHHHMVENGWGCVRKWFSVPACCSRQFCVWTNGGGVGRFARKLPEIK